MTLTELWAKKLGNINLHEYEQMTEDQKDFVDDFVDAVAEFVAETYYREDLD